MRSKDYVVSDGTIAQPVSIQELSLKECLNTHFDFGEQTVKTNLIYMFKSVEKYPQRNKIARDRLMDMVKPLKPMMECNNSHIVSSTVKLNGCEYIVVALITHAVYSSDGCCKQLPELVKQFVLEK